MSQILVFTKTAGRLNLVEVVVILKVFLIALAANLNTTNMADDRRTIKSILPQRTLLVLALVKKR